ncbi:MAG: RNA-directed polymerase [Bacteroidota bacterium]|nr:RNA-directed polymerase [Bacteroidota bacterium]
MLSLLRNIDGWLRQRLHMVIWEQRKRIKTKVTNLIKLGINRYKAYEWANAWKGYRHTAGSFILNRSVTDKPLLKAGYVFFTDYYKAIRV